MRSIQAFRVEGMLKLYIGAPITTTSAARNCSSTRSASATAAGSALARLAPVRWGRGSLSRSRYSTSRPGWRACQLATMAALSSRLTELAPRALESRCRSFMRCSLSDGAAAWPRSEHSLHRCTDGIKVVRWHHLLRLWRSRHAGPERPLLLRHGGRAWRFRRGRARAGYPQVAPEPPHQPARDRPWRAPAAAFHPPLRGHRRGHERLSPCTDHADRGPGRARGGRPPERRAAWAGAGERAGGHRPAAAAEAAAEVPRAVPEGAPAAARQQ